MSDLTLTKIRFRNGIWEGKIGNAPVSGAKPDITVMFQDQPVENVILTEGTAERDWLVAVPVPPEAVADGVQTFVIFDAADSTRLGDFTLIAGEAVADDLRAEVELLRAELDMLKRAFRRHCLETM
ncbi:MULTISPECIES: hypothetical protein [unclassified Leisingera]|uniref:hypothetical protein n=1 Tax=unclassified Leisingera TaxID=2614906 RepID=UPI0002F7AAE8|nr:MULTISPECIES: hypothetical protein [unclassified Leisingera]KIC18591.1 hypothetical protein RA21_04900 [Leisingera sp. ANG-DT]KIC22713.1 hypothetical protein RA23_18255 [Leisingera sp. ANG-S3]KIC29005.1 hypothetical protein RA24_08835 [Leisingera sp. ANG-M6]KIC32046.1 hypothetical protein RA25_13335 [Leisingera sp. ANG-S5]KIC51643.1 hypothetical protein RA22_18150 [Leisingera sp. ANG-S]